MHRPPRFRHARRQRRDRPRRRRAADRGAVQDWADDAVHARRSTTRWLGRDARLKHVVVTLGGDVVRITPRRRFTAPGGEVELLGLYFADAGQHQEHRLFVDHAVPHCRSRVTYKGALQGDGRPHGLGRRRADPGRRRGHRHLRAEPQPRADRRRPRRLGAEPGDRDRRDRRRRSRRATGRFDDEQLFYLQSRGHPEDDARRLVVRGFFVELIQQIGVPRSRSG